MLINKLEESILKEIAGDILISELIEMDSETVNILNKFGLNCMGCPASQRESLAEAAKGHSVDVKKIIDELNKYFGSK